MLSLNSKHIFSQTLDNLIAFFILLSAPILPHGQSKNSSSEKHFFNDIFYSQHKSLNALIPPQSVAVMQIYVWYMKPFLQLSILKGHRIVFSFK